MVRLDRATEDKLRGALVRAFPDARARPRDVEALAVCVRRAQEAKEELPEELRSLDLSPYADQLRELERTLALSSPQALSGPLPAADAYRYYWIKSEHQRHKPDGFTPFVGEVAMVRVTLPLRTPRSFQTRIGSVNPDDHLVDTVLEANQKFARFLDAPIGRLDLITPARQGVRFGAVSVLLGYKKPKDPTPSCYILEGGTATGQPKVLYLGRSVGATINAYTGYQPTPFACPSHAYTGRLTLEGDEPKLLEITSRQVNGGVSQTPYITIRASFQRQLGHVANIWPGFLIARAASIVLMRNAKGTIPRDCDLPPPEQTS
jgi:hypothetical protein